MAKSVPSHNLFAESLRGSAPGDFWQEFENLHLQSWQRHWLSKPSTPLLQHDDPRVHPSIHRRTHHDTTEYPIGCNKWGFAVISEAEPGGRISDIMHSDTSLEVVAVNQGDPEPGQSKLKVQERRGRREQ